MAEEPWLRGPIEGVHPVVSHLLRSSEQIQEDLERIPRPFSREAAFHVKHLAGSTERLCTYLSGGELSEGQLAAAREEHEVGGNAEELLGRVREAFANYERLVRELRTEDFSALRCVGRKRLPVTAIGLAIHIAEHGQRHVGQAISVGRLSNKI